MSNASDQPESHTASLNSDQSLKDMLAETILAMNTMIAKLASLPQLQQNPNTPNPNSIQNNGHASTNSEQPLDEQIQAPNINGSVNIPRTEQSQPTLECDPLKSRIDRVEVELSKIRVGGTRNVSFQDLCPFPNVALPDHFKLPEFEKYNGEGCPLSHLRAYCGDMVPVKSNDQLLIRYFQKSLTGPALKWFTSLDLSTILSFDQLSNQFIDQYSYNLDLEPRREDLESLRQNKGEPFTTYVGRWRAMAARVKPKPTDEECINLIIRSALPTISGYLAIQGHPNFAALIKSGSRVEVAVSQGMVPALGPQPILSSPFNAKRTKVDQKMSNTIVPQRNSDDVNVTFETTGSKPTISSQNFSQQNIQTNGPPKLAHFNTKVDQFTQKNANTSSFLPSTQTQFQRNPRKFTPLGEPPSSILSKLLKEGSIELLCREINPNSRGYSPSVFCEFHQSIGHHTDYCFNLKHAIQDFIDKGMITIRTPQPETTNIMTNPLPQHQKQNETTNNHTVNVLEYRKWGLNNSSNNIDHVEQRFVRSQTKIIEVLGVIPKKQKPIEVLGVPCKPIVIFGPNPIEVLGKPIITDLTKVPFNYEQNPVCAELSNMTRSGRIYKPSHLTTEPSPLHDKTRDDHEAPIKRDSPGYDVVSQLKKTKAEISVWELLVKSPTHYQALQRVLQTVNVPTDVEPKDLEKLVGQIPEPSQTITFSDNELPPEKEKHNRPLYIRVQYNNNSIPFVLIDNGSALNICPLRTAIKIGVDPSTLQKTSGTITGFDGNDREIIGEVSLNIMVGPANFEMSFQVVDIKSTFNLILGRPWLHAHKVVPSSLHQCLKFVYNNEMVVVMAEPEMVIPIEAGSIVINQQVPLIDTNTKQNHSNPEKMLEYLHKKWNFTPDQGLGKMNQGPVKPLKLTKNKGTRGLGYNPDELAKKTTLTHIPLKDTSLGHSMYHGETSHEGLKEMFESNLNTINVIEGIPVGRQTNPENIASSSRANPENIASSSRTNPTAPNNDPPGGSKDQLRELLLMQLEAFHMLIRLATYGQAGASTGLSFPSRGLYIPPPNDALYSRLQSLLGRIDTSLGDFKNRYAEAPPSTQIQPPRQYDGKSCPIKHMRTFCKRNIPLRYDEPTLIMVFGLTLKGQAHEWYATLAGRERMTWKDFTTKFLNRFNRVWGTPSFADLASLVQEHNEPFHMYVDRWFELANRVEQPMPPLNEIIKMAIRSSRAPLPEMLGSRVISDFKELKEVGSWLEKAIFPEAPSLKRARESNDPLQLQLGISQPVHVPEEHPNNPSEEPPREPEQYCVFHRAFGHRTEYCTDLRKVLRTLPNQNVGSSQVTNKEPEQSKNVNVITSIETVIDPIITIQTTNELERSQSTPLENDPIAEEDSELNPIDILDPDDDDLPADYLENYDMHGKLYINKKLQKKIAMHKRIQEARQAPFQQSKPQQEWRPKQRKPKYKMLRKIMEAEDIPTFVQNTTARLLGRAASEPKMACPDMDWPTTDAINVVESDVPTFDPTEYITEVSDLTRSYNLRSAPYQQKKKSN